MAQQRSKSKSANPPPSPRKDREPAADSLRTAVPAQPKPSSPAPAASEKRSTYFEAVAVYERAVGAMQRHDYRTALELLQSVLRQYPEEKELHERVRLYLNVCERQVGPRERGPA